MTAIAVALMLVIAACSGSDSAGSNPAASDSAAPDSAASDSAGSEGNGSSEPVLQNAPVTITGGKLDPIPQGVQVSEDASADAVLGTSAPTLAGTDFSGTAVEIGPDGRNKVVMFLAHWCPHCQSEVKLVAELVANGQLPDNIDLYAVTIAVSEDRDNYPPSEWLEEEAFPAAVIRDSETSAAADAFGVSGIPYVVYLDGANTVVARSTGSLDAETILRLWLETAAA